MNSCANFARRLAQSKMRARRISSLTRRKASEASFVRPPCRKLPFCVPFGAPPPSPSTTLAELLLQTVGLRLYGFVHPLFG